MQVSNVLSRYSDLAVLGRHKEAAEKASEKAAEKPAAQSATAGSAAMVREILKDYDVTDLSPRKLSEMLQRLHGAGVLTDEQFQQLALIRLDLDSQNVGPEERIDLVDHYRRRLEEVQRNLADGDWSGSDRSDPDIDRVRQWLTWLEKFALIEAAPDHLGLSSAV